MKVNILMPVYNISKNEFFETVESILNQTYEDFKLIIINDYSTDNTLQILDSFSKKESKIKILNSTGQKGIVGALNEGLKNLDNDCKYVARIDCGDLCYKDRIKKQVDFLEKNDDYYMVGTKFEVFCEEGKLSDGIQRFEKYSNQFCSYDSIKSNFTVMAPFVHSTFMFRRSIFDKIGLYNNKYEAAEDYEIVGRMMSCGYKVAKVPEILVKYKFTPGQGISQRKRLIQVKTSIKIKLEFIIKNFLDNSKKNVIIWGTKEFAGYLEEELRNNRYNMTVKYFTDFDKTKWMKLKNGIEIVSPDKMIRELQDDDIVITMWNLEREKIVNYLEDNNLIRNKNYFVFS